MYGKNNIIRTYTEQYLSTLNVSSPPPPHEMERELLKAIADAFDIECSMMPKGTKWRKLEELPPAVIADVILWKYDINRICCAGIHSDAKYDLLAIYQEDGPEKGIYVEATEKISQLASQLNYMSSERNDNEVLHQIRKRAKRKERSADPDLIAVNNGIFNYKTKQLQPFDPDIVFLSKSYVNYNPLAKNVVLHNDDDGTEWDVESWAAELSDDPEIRQLLWEVMGAIIRPHVPWDKSAWLYSESGANGKSSLCKLMQNLCGETPCASIQLTAFSEEFMLEDLVNATAIIADENEVGIYIDKVAKLKSIVTGERVKINRKYKSPVVYEFKGFMVQCLNRFPKVKDKSESFYRRNLFIPLDKCFTGAERKYIKDVYLKDPQVLEYVMFKVLNMDYYELSTPARCSMLLEEYKEFNDPVRQFFGEFEDQFVWDLLPFTFLYDLYLSWSKRVNPSGTPQGRNIFINDLINGPLKNSHIWYCQDKSTKIRVMGRMTQPEPLILQYDLKDWKNPNYHGTDVNKICCPLTAVSYRGIKRDNTTTQNAKNDEAELN